MTTENRKPKTQNRFFRMFTFGCKVNQCDAAGIARVLSERGWRPAPPGTVPDLLLVNTCTVTARADQQARQLVRRLAREHPGAALWVTGCYAQRAPAEVAALAGVQAVFGNQEKAGLAHLLADLLADLEEDRGGGSASLSPGMGGGSRKEEVSGSASPSPLRGEGWGGGETHPPPSPLPPGEGEELISVAGPVHEGEPSQGPRLLVGSFSAAPAFQPWRVHAVPGHTRAWLKIQEGCSHHCRYCIVPKVRGPRRSLEPAAVLAAFGELAGLGYREVVLTGVDLAQYGLDHAPPGSLAALVRRLSQSPWPFRVRLSSLEPMMVTAELLEELAAWGDFCPHFHLPLQSGAAPVLAAMGRPYGPAEFRDLVGEIARRFPGAGLGLDVLVGFPGESEADFAATRDLVAALPVTYLHVFPFSPRPDTPAAALPPLPGRVVQARARIMRELGQAKKRQFLAAQLGQVREVLVEGPAPQPGWLQGLSDHYLRVAFPGPAAWRNRRIRVRFQVAKEELLLGKPVDEP